MATIEQPQTTDTIEVENPATGEVIRSLPVTSAADVAEMAARARAAQPGWEALGFEGRGRVLRRMQKWLVDKGEGGVQTIVRENGKKDEGAPPGGVAHRARAPRLLAKRAPPHPA